MSKFLPEPTPFEGAALVRTDLARAVDGAQVVEQHRDRHEPAVLRGKPPEEQLQPWFEPAPVGEVMPEVHVHDAGAAFRLEPVLLALGNRLYKRS